jgi:hypothetical protein
MDDVNDMTKHGKIQITDYTSYCGYSCDGCGGPSTYVMFIGSTAVRLCADCLADIGHCAIDGLK